MQLLDIHRTVLWLAAVACQLALVSCAPPATVHRPVIRRDEAAPAPGNPSAGAAAGLQHRDELQGLVQEAQQAIRIRLFARPLQGDPTTDALARVCQEVLQLARVPTRFDRDDPVANAAVAREALRLGVLPLGVSPAGESPTALPPEAEYRALVVAIGTEVAVVPQVEASRGELEFQLAEVISRLLHGPRQLGLATPSARQSKLTKLSQLLTHLELRAVDLRRPLPEQLSAVVVVAGQQPFPRSALDNLRNFLKAGRAAAFLLDGMRVQPQRRRYVVRPARHGLERLLGDYGVRLQSNLVFDRRCGRVSVPARVGRMLLPYPPIPQVEVVDTRMITEATQVRLPFASSLAVEPNQGWEVVPLLRSSGSSWAVDRRFDLSPYQEWQPRGERGPFVVGVSLEEQGKGRGRLAVIGSARFIEDAYLAVDDNAAFARQLIEWLGGHRNLARMMLARDHAGRGDGEPPAGPVAQGRP